MGLLKPTQEWPLMLESGQPWNPIGLFSSTVAGGAPDLVSFVSFKVPQGLSGIPLPAHF